MLGPASGPAIRYHVEHTWPEAVDVRFATQPSPLGTVDAVLSASDYVGAAPYGVGNADDIYGGDGCALLAEHLRAGDDANALVGYRLADAVIGFSPVTRGICRVADDGQLLGVDERRQVHATADGGFVAGDGREPTTLSADARVSMNLWGFTAAFHRTLRAAMDRSRRRVRRVRGSPARGRGPVARHELLHRPGGPGPLRGRHPPRRPVAGPGRGEPRGRRG